MSQTSLTLITPLEAAGQRLDRWLAAVLPDHSRSAVQRWIDDGLVQIGEQEPRELPKPSRKLAGGETITVDLPAAPAPTSLEPEALALPIVYEDADLIVVDKPAGMVVHPAPGHRGGTLVNAVLHHAPEIEGVGGERRPGIVHRLDRDTSGLLVVAKNDRAHRYLQAQFKARTVYKEYLALVEGRLQPEVGRIVAPIGRHPSDRQRQAVLLPDAITGLSAGREAVTEYHVLATYTASIYGSASAVGAFTLVSALLLTGRTHQIRVHFAWLKHPIVGDRLYGYKTQRLPTPRQFLHAHRLRLRLPSTGAVHEFVSPLPADLQAVLDKLEANPQSTDLR